MTDNEAIKFHLTNFYNETFGLIFFSGFCGALKDARKMTNRNIETGAKDTTNTFGHLGSWLGTIGYLTLLDQIGCCFKRTNGPIIEMNKSGIIKALKNFSNLGDNEINAIYALRNSFAHDYSLQNVSNRHGLTHHFTVDNSNSKPAIILPRQNWNGFTNNKTSQNGTYVNLQALGDIVEKLILNIIELVDSNEIKIILPGGKDELIARYSFVTGSKVI